MSSKLTPEQLSTLRKKLETKRDDLRRKRAKHLESAEAPSEEGGNIEVGDIAEREHEIADTVGLADHEQAELLEVLHALEKFEKGTYGVSEKSGRAIPYARLDAIPWARVATGEA